MTVSKTTLAIIGGGNMGQALLGGLIDSGWKSSDITVVEVDDAKRAHIQKTFGVVVASKIVPCDGAIVAVKPGAVIEVCKELRNVGVSRVLSIAAGISTTSMQDALGNDAVVVRAMPNTPALVREGVSAIVGSPACSEQDVQWAESLLRAVGIVQRVDEGDIDAVTAVAGSGPGYVLLMAEALIDAAVDEGLSREVATTLVRQLFKGTGALFAQSEHDAATLREQVTSPGGTTAAGLGVFEQQDFREIVKRAVHAAAARSREMGQ